MNDEHRTRTVGIDLQDSEESRALVDAIEEDNPDAEISRMPGLVQIKSTRELVIRRETVEQRMGREWETPIAITFVVLLNATIGFVLGAAVAESVIGIASRGLARRPGLAGRADRR